jgi:hypothetical protein
MQNLTAHAFSALALVAALACAGCEPQVSEVDADEPPPDVSVSLDQILKDLASEDPEARKRAAEQLDLVAEQGLSIDEGRRALAAAAQSWPADEEIDASRSLLAAGLNQPEPEYWRLVVQDFPRYSEGARWDAVDRLAEIGDRDAAQTYLDLLRSYAAINLMPAASVDNFANSPEAARLLIPAALEYCHADELGFELELLALRAMQSGNVHADALSTFVSAALDLYEPSRERLHLREESEGDDWIWTEGYAEDRSKASLLLDLMGYMPGNEIEKALTEALGSRDPRLKYFAAMSLLRHGREVPAEVFDAIAASPEVRSRLHESLKELKRGDLFPAKYATPESFAEAEMVEWLVYPTELGRTPHEIDLAATFDGQGDDADRRYYLFRFRTRAPHWAAEKGWMAGIAGPFDSSASPQPAIASSTFSTFTPWDEKSPRDHFAAITGLSADEWTERKAD